MKLLLGKNKLNIAAIMIAALILRLVSVNQSFWLDEATSGLAVRNLSYSQIINDFSPGDFHPPLYYLTLKFWSGIFGDSEIGLRSLSLVFGLASVYLTFLVGNYFSKKAGLLAALFLAVNGLHIYYSQEARMYSMSVFLVLFMIYLFIRMIESERKKYWFLFSLVLVLNAFTDYLPSLVILLFWIYALLAQKGTGWWKKFILSHIPLVVFALIWFPYFLKQIQLGLGVRDEGSLWWNVLGRTDIKNTLLVPVKFVFGRISFYDKSLYFILSAAVLSLYSLIIVKGSKKLFSDRKFLLIILWLAVPLIASALIGFEVSVFSYFRLIFVLPALMIILALGILNLPERWQKASFVFVLAVSLVSSIYYLSTPRFQREDWRGLVNYVENASENYDYRVVFASDAQWEGYKYYAGPKNMIIRSGEVDADPEILWYIRYVQDVFDPADLVRAKIEGAGYEMKNSYDFNGIIVWKYENSN
jgi:uncharacterized membrane protein